MIEPEETIEANLIALLSAQLSGMDVIGALSPVPEGAQKSSPDTYVSVFADVASQDMDWEGPGIPFTYSVRVVVHFAQADDKTGTGFRDRCREVRAALQALLGDGCASLDGDGFECDSFILGATNTAQDLSADSGGMIKTYNATVKGRYNEPQEEETT